MQDAIVRLNFFPCMRGLLVAGFRLQVRFIMKQRVWL